MRNKVIKFIGATLAVLIMILGLGIGLMLPVLSSLAIPGVVCMIIIKECIKLGWPWATIFFVWCGISLWLYPKEVKRWQIRSQKFHHWAESRRKVEEAKPMSKLQRDISVEIFNTTVWLDRKVSKLLGLKPRE